MMYVIKNIEATKFNHVYGDSKPFYLHQDDFGTIKTVRIENATHFTEHKADKLISAYKHTPLVKEVFPVVETTCS